VTDQQTILLVDDSENDLWLMRVALEKAHFRNPLQVARNGEEAIAYLKGDGRYSNRAQFPFPAVVLLDLNMPMKSGFDVLQWVRAQPALKRLTMIVLTASMRLEDQERAYELGVQSFLVKPNAMEDLVDMMRTLRDWLEINHFPPLNSAVGR